MWVQPQTTRFQTLCRYGQERSFSGTSCCDRERLSLTSLEVITDALLEIMEVSDILLFIYLKVYYISKCDNYIGIIMSSYKKIVHSYFCHFLSWCIISEELHMHLLSLYVPVCLFVSLHVKTLEPLNGFSPNLILGRFTPHIPVVAEVKHCTWGCMYIPACNLNITL
jgi:hypothetical protein